MWAPTTIEARRGLLEPVRRDAYYSINAARDFHRLTRKQVIHLSGLHNLSAYLRKNAPIKGGSFGTILLDAAGINHKLSSDQGVIPA